MSMISNSAPTQILCDGKRLAFNVNDKLTYILYDPMFRTFNVNIDNNAEQFYTWSCGSLEPQTRYGRQVITSNFDIIARKFGVVDGNIFDVIDFTENYSIEELFKKIQDKAENRG